MDIFDGMAAGGVLCVCGAVALLAGWEWGLLVLGAILIVMGVGGAIVKGMRASGGRSPDKGKKPRV